MAYTYKVLGQVNPTANTDTTLYTVPANTSTVVSTITICNQLPTTANFRIAVRPAGESISSKHYINYDTQVPGNDQIALTIGMSLATTDVVTVYANTANVSFNIFGSEIA
jgi:glucose-6-phosphate dehydrogenase assembly protein OpcA